MILRLNANGKNFQKELVKKINKRSVFSNKDYNVAKKIVLDVKKNGDKAVLKYEFRFNKNKRINSNYSSISKIIKSLNPNVKKSIDFAYQRILKFHKLKSNSTESVLYLCNKVVNAIKPKSKDKNLYSFHVK